ncbi:carbohydrate kinase family protein [Thermosediminibacter oceani]|uniref:carbohydrate kinase family protein n=1 Tax=Thermosediminibacter oceani TaxID=291990 RepID=UPI00059E68CD|nr:sugar kinase [Thermosediminibacter oceani]
MPEVTCIGILVADIIGAPVIEYPEAGRLVTVDSIGLYTGGCAVNTAIALSRLGIKTGLIGKVGCDYLGEFLIDSLKKEGVDTGGIVRTDVKNTSSTIVIVDKSGERSFIHYVGANAEFGLDDMNFELLKGNKIVHIAGSFLMPKFDGIETAKALKRIKEMGVTTSVDTAWDASGRWLKTIEPCLPYIDIFIPSIDEAKMISGEEKPEKIAEFFMSYGIKTVVIKMGSAGSFGCNKQEQIYMPPFKVEVKDTTGAGDSFVAGFLTGIVREFSLEESLELGNAAGALCVTSYGASAGIKSLADTLEFIKRHKDGEI